MQILADHQYRLPLRQRLELPQQCAQCPLLLALRAEVQRRKALAVGKRQHLGDQREVARLRPSPSSASSLSSFIVAVSSWANPAARFSWPIKGYSALS
jgi:hypothetical protein